MSIVHTRGDPASRIWFIFDHPFPSDIPKGYILSGGLGYLYEKMLAEAGLYLNDCYACSRRPDPESPTSYASVDSALDHYKPPFICVVNEVGSYFLPELRARSTKESYKTQLNKYVGSLLSCERLSWPHYMIPVYGPDKCAQDWKERNISTYVDFQKLRDEHEYWKKTGTIQPLRSRRLLYSDFDIGDILTHFERFSRAKYLSTDIETVYPKKNSAFYPHPGYAFVIGLADSADFGISFELFRESQSETRILWRALDDLLYGSNVLGQNFFNFDVYFLQALGFRIQLRKIQDTLLRHHILWPELPHKLQFLTRQYTRQPYYKDEGKHWSMKHLAALKKYNCLDVTVTYEVFEGQEEEFKDRLYLKGVA